MKKSDHPVPAGAAMRDRILGAAFEAFTGKGYAATSTLDIAKRAKVSKRDLYANFSSKQAVLVACIKRRTERMQLLPDLPEPRDRQMLAAVLTAFATNVVREISDASVIAAFRLAIAEASRSPEIAQTLDAVGRSGARQALAKLVASAQSSGLFGQGDPTDMAKQYFGLLWEGLMVSLLLGVARAPGPAEAERRARNATAAFMRLHPGPATKD
jgi:AcrR family transcriptional regulator